MNLSLLKIHISRAYHLDINPKLDDDKKNVNCFYNADTVGHKRFAQNFGGYPRSEIAEINAQANLQNQMNLLSELQDFSTGNNPNSGLTDAEIMLSHRSKYMQTASEMQGWIENQLSIRDARREFAQVVESSNKGGNNEVEESPAE